MDNYIFGLADQLKELKDRKKELDAEAKAVGAQIEELDRELSDAMAEAECERFSRNGSTFYLNTRLFASQGYGDIVTETVNANTLASFVKEQMALNCDEVPAWLADCVSTYEKVSVGIRKG